MKILIISTAPELYIKKFYDSNKGLQYLNYTDQKSIYDNDHYGWSFSWKDALNSYGYEAYNITINNTYIQKAWQKEYQKSNENDLRIIAINQAKLINPDILWFDHYDELLLKSIKSDVKNIRATVGYVGSAIPKTNIWSNMDLILSCAQETVDYFTKLGLNAVQIHHAFDPRINSTILANEKNINVSFIGNIIRSDAFHLTRDKILEELIKRKIDTKIFTPSKEISTYQSIKPIIQNLVSFFTRRISKYNFGQSIINFVPILKKSLNWNTTHSKIKNPILYPHFEDSVYGLKLFQLLKNSKITLNIHADSSPYFASNMRLWESTGVGTCLLTDNKSNMSELFEIGKEVYVYNNVDECADIINWLLDHPLERETIALAGQKRCLHDHTYSNRVVELDKIFKNNLIL